MADDGTQEFNVTQEMADEVAGDYQSKMRAAEQAADVQFAQHLPAGFSYVPDEDEPNFAYIVHDSAMRDWKKGDPDPILLCRIRVGTLGPMMIARQAQNKDTVPDEADAILNEMAAISPATPRQDTPHGGASPAIDIGKAVAEAPGTPLGKAVYTKHPK